MLAKLLAVGKKETIATDLERPVVQEDVHVIEIRASHCCFDELADLRARDDSAALEVAIASGANIIGHNANETVLKRHEARQRLRIADIPDGCRKPDDPALDQM